MSTKSDYTHSVVADGIEQMNSPIKVNITLRNRRNILAEGGQNV
jgi:hypothetical protein